MRTLEILWEETKYHGIESIGSTAPFSTATKKSCWHWQFLLDFPKKMKYLSSNFLVCARITRTHTQSLSLALVHSCVCVFIYNACVCMRVVLYVLFFSLTHAHAYIISALSLCISLLPAYGKQTTGIAWMCFCLYTNTAVAFPRKTW